MTPQEQIAALADVPVAVEFELDRKTMTMGAMLQLDAGSIVALGRAAGDNIDLRVGGALVGFGEIVILEGAMGVRITDFSEDR